MRKLMTGVMTMMTVMTGGATAATRGKVLVVLSSESQITLKGGGTHATGFFLSELAVPVSRLIEAGYEPVFASPGGTRPVMDRVSDSAFWFGGNEARYREVRGICERLGVCAPGTNVGTRDTERLADVIAGGLDRFAAVFFPGGHAPMEELWKSPEVRTVLRYFHEAGKPTALICHAPIALLAALDDPEGYIRAKEADDRAGMVEKSRGWIYRDYALTVFTTREEQQEETGGSDGVLGGFVRFYPDEALEKAGAFVARANKWQSNVVIDRELITGQNPFSDEKLAEALLQRLAN